MDDHKKQHTFRFQAGHGSNGIIKIYDGFRSPILSITTECDGVRNTQEFNLSKGTILHLVDYLKQFVDHEWFSDTSLAQGDFDCLGQPDCGTSLDDYYRRARVPALYPTDKCEQAPHDPPENLRLNDKIRVTINDEVHEVLVAGVSRGFGSNADIRVKFYIDWDEGHAEYDYPISMVRKVEDEPCSSP